MGTLNLVNQFQGQQDFATRKGFSRVTEQEGNVESNCCCRLVTSDEHFRLLGLFRNLFYFAWKNNYSRTTSFPGPFPLENGKGGKKPWERG